MGKGSAPRPFEVDHGTFTSNWDNIFGKKSNGNGNQPTTSNQVHGGDSTVVRQGEGGQDVHRELPADSEIKVNE